MTAPTRDELITSLLKLASALATDERIPLDGYTFEASHSVGLGVDDDAAGHAELARIAEVLDVEIEHSGSHHYARKMFGQIRYQALYIDRQHMAEHRDFMATRPAWEAAHRVGAVSE